QTQPMCIERLQVQRPRALGVRALVVLHRERRSMYELRLRPRLGVNQVEVPRCAMTGCEQKTRGAHGNTVFRDHEVAEVGESLLVATTGRSPCGWLRDIRVLSDERRCDAPIEKNDRDECASSQLDHCVPPFRYCRRDVCTRQ